MTSSYPAASRRAPKSSRLACRNSIRPRRSGSSRHCRSERGGQYETFQSFRLGGQPSRIDPVPRGCAWRGRLLLLRAARPRRGSLLHGQGCQRFGDLARRDCRRNADPGRGPDREEAAGTAVLRKGADLLKTGVHGDAGHLQGFDPGKRRAVPVLSAAQEDR